MMRNGLAVLFIVACGGGQQQTTTNNDVHLDKPDAAVVALPNQAVQPLGIPHDAPFVASFDVTAFAHVIPLRQEIARELDVDDTALLAQAASFGLDTKRPATLAIGPLDDTEKRAVTELQAQFKDPSVTPTDDAIKRILTIESPLMIRVLVPTTNSEKLEQMIAKFLKSDNWHKNATGWAKHGQFIAFDDDGQNVAVDVMVTHEKADPKALRAFAATAHDPIPALDGRTARAVWSSQSIAAIGYLTDIVRAASAVSGASVDAGQRARIMREGLTEAARTLQMATFDKIEMEGRLAPFELVGRATPNASFTMPPADAFAQSTGISFGASGAVAVAQASRAFMNGWPFPGGSVKSAIEAMRDGGGGAIFAGLPHLLAMIPAIDARRERDVAPFEMKRFERVATVYGQGPEIFVSVMPAGTKRADAECAFAPQSRVGAPCDAKTKLKLNAVAKVGDLNAKLYEIAAGAEKRFVVVSSDSDSAKLDAPLLVQAGGMRLDVDTSVFTRFLDPNTLPAKSSGEITSENGVLVFRAK
ncbi:MAG TPA: hypothetical protein VH054_01220 [Polyangiaceae bacterium]|jgi:hypothetical protein|nr:hypothetical protein [Polyangiaceae bacterium]